MRSRVEQVVVIDHLSINKNCQNWIFVLISVDYDDVGKYLPCLGSHMIVFQVQLFIGHQENICFIKIFQTYYFLEIETCHDLEEKRLTLIQMMQVAPPSPYKYTYTTEELVWWWRDHRQIIPLGML